MTAAIAPLLGGLFLVLAVGALLRWRAGMGAREADTLNRLIIDVTMPALLVHVLSTRDFVWHAGLALLASTVGLVVAGALGFVVARLAGADRRAQGAALLTSAFSNTGFLGFPLILAVFHGDAAASSTALVVDTVDTTLLLWTLGLAVAQNLGDGSRRAGVRGHLMVTLLAFARPITVALALGLLLRGTHVALPGFVDGALASLGACTTPLVFLALGLQLDPKAIRGRVSLVAGVAAIKLAVAPLVALAAVRVLHVAEPAASVAVLEIGMPSAMASVIVAARSGCDRSLAAGVATLATVACVATLPALGWLLDITR